MFNPNYSTDRALQVGFNISLDSHINHTNSKIIVIQNYSEFGIEHRYNNKIKNELSVFYALLMNQYIFKYQTAFSAIFDKQEENIQVKDETELFINLNFNHNLTETAIDNIDIRSQLEHQIEREEQKNQSGGLIRLIQ